MPAPASPTLDTITITDDDLAVDEPWVALLLDDPVTTFDYVIGVLQKLFGFDRAHAERIAWEVHTDGKAGVLSGTLPEAEAACLKLLNAGLRARFEQGGGK